MIGTEALIRWQHEYYGMIPPDTFIPLAEQHHLIHHITKWVMETACGQHNHAAFHSQTMSVNISAKELMNFDIVNLLTTVIEMTNIKPSSLILEITETAMMDDIDMALQVAQALKEQGIALHLDDFGIGYASIDYLRRFPLDALKIDRSFISSMHQNSCDTRVIKLMIDIGHDLDLKVIAEGIETKEQFTTLQSLGCDIGQGYYLGKPMPAKDYMTWLYRHNSKDHTSAIYS